ncbi:hypothetical protein ACVWZR_009878 [Bradyrhizobium sp. i1.3.1]
MVLDVAALEVILDADHEHRRELVVVANLHAADGALDLAAADADEIIERVVAALCVAGVEARIETRPRIHRLRRRVGGGGRGVARRQVGSAGAARGEHRGKGQGAHRAA